MTSIVDSKMFDQKLGQSGVCECSGETHSLFYSVGYQLGNPAYKSFPWRLELLLKQKITNAKRLKDAIIETLCLKSPGKLGRINDFVTLLTWSRCIFG